MSNDRVVCCCRNLTEEQLLLSAKSMRSPDVNQLMRSTGAGMDCTACLLDLELILGKMDTAVSVKLDRGRQNLSDSLIRNPRNFKQRLYRGIDACFPTIPTRSRVSFPILVDDQFDVCISFSNYGVMFGETSGNGDIDIEVAFHDSEGNLLKTEKHALAQKTEVHLSSKEALKQYVDNDCFIGSGFITQAPRGKVELHACRSQIALHCPDGITTVHTQFMHGKSHYLFLPQHEGTTHWGFFRNVDSVGGGAQFRLIGQDGAVVKEHHLSLPGYGARLLDFTALFGLSELPNRPSGFMLLVDADFHFHLSQLTQSADKKRFAMQH